MTGAERRKQIFESTKNAFIGFLGEMLKEKIKQIIVEQVISKTAKATSIVEAQATGALIAQAYAVPAFLASTASFGSASIMPCGPSLPEMCTFILQPSWNDLPKPIQRAISA